MLIKAGVDISRLNREIRRALNKASIIISNYDQEIIITSTYEGNHSAGSLHYSNDAFDFRHTGITLDDIADELRRFLTKGFDVVLESDHIHVEYDPD
ncbi:hypothetical protein ES702_02179 [subsurface metagenome]